MAVLAHHLLRFGNDFLDQLPRNSTAAFDFDDDVVVVDFDVLGFGGGDFGRVCFGKVAEGLVRECVGVDFAEGLPEVVCFLGLGGHDFAVSLFGVCEWVRVVRVGVAGVSVCVYKIINCMT